MKGCFILEKAKVYFTRDISSEGLMKIYEALSPELPGKVAVKVHSGEPGVSDGTIVSSVNANSLTLAELRYCAKNVLRYALKNI